MRDWITLDEGLLLRFEEGFDEGIMLGLLDGFDKGLEVGGRITCRI